MRYPRTFRALVLAALPIAGCECAAERVGATRGFPSIVEESLDFGAVPLGARRLKRVTLKNLGGGPLVLLRIEPAPGVFSYDDTPLQVDAGREALFGLTFTPEVEGLQEATLTFVTDGDPETVTLPVRGTGVRELVTIDPVALDFGAVVLGRTKMLDVTIANPGGVPATISIAGVGGADASSFGAVMSAPNPQNAYLQPTETVKVQVTFAPVRAGDHAGALAISSCDGCTPMEIALTGFGLDRSLDVGPCPLDFGTVLPETPVTQELTIENVGPYPVTVNSVRPAQAGDFAVTPVTSYGQNGAPPELQPGAKITLQVTYLPASVGADVNVLLIDSNDEASPRVECQLIGASDCDNAGGQGLAERACYAGPDGTAGVGACRAGSQACTSTGWSECVGQVTPQSSGSCTSTNSDVDCDGQPDPSQPAPIADAGADQIVEPLDTVTLDASQSSANGSGSLSYTWRIIRKPQGSNTAVQGSGARPTLWADIAGEYEIGLVVVGQNGCSSAEDSVLITAIPRSKIHIQLVWDKDKVDVDLHWRAPGGVWFDDLFLTDCFYATQSMCDFGTGGWPDGRTSNDPTLDRDDIDGLGPENINHDQPFNGAYRIGVNYYCAFRDNADQGAALATVRVFVDGIKKLDVQRSLTERDMWEVADVTVSGSSVSVTARSGAPTKTTNALGYCAH
jgi:hypothetical protein